MQPVHVSSHPLIQSVVHKSFASAISDIGLREFPRTTFDKELIPYLKSPDSRLEETPQSVDRFWKSVIRGEVIATEVWNDEEFVFYVRGELGNSAFHVRFAYHAGEWRLFSEPQFYPLFVVRSRWFQWSSLAVCAIVAGVIGYAIHRQPPAAPAKVVYVKTFTPTPTATGKTSKSPGAHTTSTGHPAATGHTTPTSSGAIKIHLSLGESLYSFAQALQSHHLVSNAMSFDLLMGSTGVDKDVKPGVYVFHPGMSQTQLLNVIKGGPSA